MTKKLFVKLLSLFLNDEQLFEYQMKKQFNAKKFPKIVYCDYCGKLLKSGTKKKAGDVINRWVGDDAGETYFCNACDNTISEARDNAIKDLCICKIWRTNPTIERCLDCKDKVQCERLLTKAEQNAIKNIREKTALDHGVNLQKETRW